jgi:hypothetical protein
MPYSLNSSFQVSWEDGEHLFCRGSSAGDDGNRNAVLAVACAGEHPTPVLVGRPAHA